MMGVFWYGVENIELQAGILEFVDIHNNPKFIYKNFEIKGLIILSTNICTNFEYEVFQKFI